MKKTILVLLVFTMLMTSLAGCGAKTTSASETSKVDDITATDTAEATEAETTAAATTAMDLTGKKVVVGRWGGNEFETAAFKKMVTDFTAKTGVIVEERVYSDYNTELQAELIGGNGPDVFYVDTYMAPFYIQQGVLMPLDEATFEISKFYPSLENSFAQDGTFYAVSKDYSTLALYYNKAYVNEADIPKTLEELFGGDYLLTLKETLPEGMAAMTYNQDLARELFMAEANGASVLKDEIYSNVGDAAISANLKAEYDAVLAGKLVTPQDLGMGWNGDAFGNEKTAIMIEGNWTLSFLQQSFPDVEFGVIEVPTFAGEKGTMVFTVGYAINAASKQVDAATAFIQYATGTEGMATWTAGAGVLPSREDVAIATKVGDNPLLTPHIAGAAYATPWQKGTTMDTINQEYKNFLPSVVKGEKTLEEAMLLAEEEANKTIEANQ